MIKIAATRIRRLLRLVNLLFDDILKSKHHASLATRKCDIQNSARNLRSWREGVLPAFVSLFKSRIVGDFDVRLRAESVSVNAHLLQSLLASLGITASSNRGMPASGCSPGEKLTGQSTPITLV